MEHLDPDSTGAIGFRAFMAHFGRLSDDVLVRGPSSQSGGTLSDDDDDDLQPVELKRVSTLQLVVDDDSGNSDDIEAGTPAGNQSSAKQRQHTVLTEARHMAIAEAADCDLLGQLCPMFGATTARVSNDATVTSRSMEPVHIVGRGVLVSSGAFYYEVTLVVLDGGASCVIGWAQGSFTGAALARNDGARGDDQTSLQTAEQTLGSASAAAAAAAAGPPRPCRWGVDVSDAAVVVISEYDNEDGMRAAGIARNEQQQQDDTRPSRAGDVIGCFVDADHGIIVCTRNGKPFGDPIRFEAPASRASATNDGTGDLLTPCVTIVGACSARVNYGAQPLSSCHSTAITTARRTRRAQGADDSSSSSSSSELVVVHKRFRPLHAWVCARQEALVAESVGGRFGKLVPTSGSTGLVITGRTATFQHGFPSCKLAGVLLTQGKWYVCIGGGAHARARALVCVNEARVTVGR